MNSNCGVNANFNACFRTSRASCLDLYWSSMELFLVELSTRALTKIVDPSGRDKVEHLFYCQYLLKNKMIRYQINDITKKRRLPVRKVKKAMLWR